MPAWLGLVPRLMRKSYTLGRSRPALLLHGAVLSIGLMCAGRAADHASVLAKPPTGPAATATAAPTTVPAAVEFRGVVREGNVWWVNLYQVATKKASWIPVGGEAAGLLVQGYEEATGRVSVLAGGQPLLLPLKQSRVVLQGDHTPLKRLDPAERVTPTEAPQMPDFMRDLPPEARKLLEEARRRRAIRWPAMPVEAAPPAARP
jgi:hypothetical protein